MSVPGPYAAVLEALEAWIPRAAAVFPGVAQGASDLRERLEQVRGAGGRLEAPLSILIAGGTGAGKSTLLNALAGGEPVAEASAVRPTTTALTCYYHVENELALPPDLRDGAHLAPHWRPALRDKVILDAPDFDSTVAANEAILRRALAPADLVLAVATPEKYADADLYRLLEEHRRGRTFVFILNRLDLGIAPEVVADFRTILEQVGFVRPRVLVLSALAAYRQKRGDPQPGPPGDFPALERLIAEELTRARAREIKRLNLDALVERLLDLAAARVPADVGERIERWRAAATEQANAAASAVGEALARAIASDAALERDLRARIATACGGLFGFYQALVWGVRGLRGRGAAAVAAAALGPIGGTAPGAEARMASGMGAAPAEADLATLAAEVALAAGRMDDGGPEVGLARPEKPLDAERAAAFVDAARSHARSEIAATLAAEGDLERRGAARRVASVLFNAGPVGVLGYALFRWGEALTQGMLLGASWFLGTGLVAVVLLALGGMLADRLAARRARRVVRALAEAAGAAARREIERPLLFRLERTLGEAESAARAIDGLREEARAAARAWPPAIADGTLTLLP